MTTIDLELRKASDTPKCKNCQHWFCPPVGLQNLGRCQTAGNDAVVMTQDLSVCSAWEQAVDPVLQVKTGAQSG